MKSTAASLSLKLGISRVTIFSLKKRYPDQAPKDFGQTEKWRSFCLAHVIDPEVITKLIR
jgi:hypothetical protein